jgi:hypothetical protein
MNIYLYEDAKYGDFIKSNLDVYEITKTTNDEIHPSKMFDTNVIIKFNDPSLCNDTKVCIINIIYNKNLFSHHFKPDCNYYIIYIDNDDYSNDTFTYNLIHKERIKLILNQIFFNWFNYRHIFEVGMHKNIKKTNINYSSFILSCKSTDTYTKENGRYYCFFNYLKKYGLTDSNYYFNFCDNLNNFDWIKSTTFPIFGFNRHHTNKKCILFQLVNYQDKSTLLSYKINVPFHEKIKKCAGYFSQMGSCTRDNNWYHFQTLDMKDTYDTNFLLLSNFDRFSFCYKYIKNELFDVGLIRNDKNKIVSNFFPWLIKERKSINELNQYMFHICLNGNDLGSSMFWQLLSFNVVFIPFPFEYQSIFLYGLQPYIHFVPISNKLFDVEEKLKYMLNNIELCEKIANNAHNYCKLFIENDCEFLDLISIDTIQTYNTFLKDDIQTTQTTC